MDSSSKILESIALESKKLSLRALAQDKAWQSNSAQAESNQINGCALARNLESVALGLGAKGVKKEGGIRESSLPIQAPLPPLERTLSQTKLESSHTAQKVESSFKKADSMDCRDLPSKSRNDRKPSPHILESKRHKLHTSTYSLHTFLESIFEKMQMDCHATATALARNDRENAPTLKTLQAQAKLDSRNEAQNLKTPAKDSRICDEKSGLCKRVQGRILGVCNCSTREAIHDLSRKAESTSQIY